MSVASSTGVPCDRAELERHLREVVFAPSDDPDLVGVEVELIPVDAATGRVLPVEPAEPGAPAAAPFLRALAARRGWRPTLTPAGVPAFQLPGGGQLSFEPGGQLEYSAPAYRSVDVLADRLDAVVAVVAEAAASAGVALVTRGYDPRGPGGRPELRVSAERYTRMAAHYDRIGPWGRRMMCRSAAVHVNVDLGPDPLRRWSVARRAAPSLLAAFANSPRAHGRDTGHRSWRAAQWRFLDPGRTGLPGAERDPVPGYADFALGARAFLTDHRDAPAEPFARRVEAGEATLAEAEAHLSTLFPEVRPRGYLELRCFDALPPRWWSVPATVCAGLLYDPDTLAEAVHTLPEPGPRALYEAGRLGVRDARVRRRALRVVDLALEGAEALPRGMVGPRALERARDFRDRLTARGRDPGDEADGSVGADEG